jgi:hypothetical protein
VQELYTLPRMQRLDGVLENAEGRNHTDESHAVRRLPGRKSLCPMPKSQDIQEEKNMMSQPEMVSLALKFGTKEKAREIVDVQVKEMVDVLNYDEAEARRVTLVNIGYYTGYLDHETADRIMDLFETEHPVFGRTHPTPQEAFRLGRELGEKAKRRALAKERTEG